MPGGPGIEFEYEALRTVGNESLCPIHRSSIAMSGRQQDIEPLASWAYHRLCGNFNLHKNATSLHETLSALHNNSLILSGLCAKLPQG
jgi:hypothetical protein